MISYKTASDEFLMQRFSIQIDEHSISELFDRYVEQARAVACQYLGCGSQADDAVQDTFVKIIRNRSKYNASQPFIKWFYTVLRNECKDHLRKRKLRTAEDIDNIEAESTIVDFQSKTDDELKILQKLEFRERQVLHLRIVESMSFEEIAIALGITTEAAKKRSQRGIAKLRSIMSNDVCKANNVIAN
jgi:RNA polymerase sigma-70 factor (ECF subfamily)